MWCVVATEFRARSVQSSNQGHHRQRGSLLCTTTTNPSEANVPRAAVCNILRKSKPPRDNLTFGEKEALKALRKNEEIVIAKADKGNVTVVMNKEDYETKASEILQVAPFQPVDSDTTTATERKLNQTLKNLLDKKAISKPLYNHLRVSPGCSKPALFYGLPKIHKENIPLRPIVSHTGHSLYNTAKYLARLLSPFSKIMPSHVENPSHLAEILRKTTIGEDEVLVSFDVKSLFTSIPVQPAINCVRKILLADPSWAFQSPISVSVIIELLTICLEDTSFKFRGKFYRMTDGLAMGSPVSPIVANIFMENLECNAIVTMKDRPRLWLRFVDDVLAIVKRTSLPSMLEHLNKQNAAITFTMEVEKDGKLPFLDGEIERENARLNLSVYRKPTHSGRYLNFNSHHPISAKCSTADALFDRAELITTDATQKDEEFRKVTQELLANDYPSRFVASRLDRAKNRKQQAPSPTSSRRQQERITTVVMPFVDDVTQPLQRVLKPLNIRVVGKPATWKWCLQHLLKNSSNRDEEPGVVYRLICNDCDQTYIGETGRTASTRAKEHASYVRNGRFDMSAAADHAIINQHSLSFKTVQIVDHEPRAARRRVKEALHIRTEKNPMNKDRGLELDPIWFSVV